MGYKNNSRGWTLALIFLFSFWAKYFISAAEVTTQKLAAGLGATILITQLNFDFQWDYSWRLLASVCVGALFGIVGSAVPFPNAAMKEVSSSSSSSSACHGSRRSHPDPCLCFLAVRFLC